MIRPHPSRELPKHYLQAALLMLIEDQPAYGYNLRDQLGALGVEQHDWGQLYRTLRGLEKRGLVLSCWETSEAGPSRRTYHVTDKGRTQLALWAGGMAAAQPFVATFLARYGADGEMASAAESA
ncbi:MAG: helix-turn-helix transcriptional regulator [Actinomycetota bacterium]